MTWLGSALSLASACHRHASSDPPDAAASMSQPSAAPSAASLGPAPAASSPPDAADSGCSLPDQPGFNHYTLAAVNDTVAWPRDGTLPYCWGARGDRCRGHWGTVHDAAYQGRTLFEGGGDCYCSGHTLELFLHAYRLWQRDHGVDESAPLEVNGYQLLAGDIERQGEHGGVFYQLWQGFGCTDEASAARAFDAFGIGRILGRDAWHAAIPGDYVNFARKNGTGHAVIFVGWVERGGKRIGIRYYGCNAKGDSCPDPTHPSNVRVRGGPSFVTERFVAHGGQVIPSRLTIGRPGMPTTPH